MPSKPPGNDWRRLRELFEPEANLMDNAIDNNEKENSVENDQARTKWDLFLNEVEEPYAKIEVNGHEEVFKIGSQRFKGLLRLLYFRVRQASRNRVINTSCKYS